MAPDPRGDRSGGSTSRPTQGQYDKSPNAEPSGRLWGPRFESGRPDQGSVRGCWGFRIGISAESAGRVKWWGRNARGIVLRQGSNYPPAAAALDRRAHGSFVMLGGEVPQRSGISSLYNGELGGAWDDGGDAERPKA
jgi:hypothetical protein